MGVEEKLQDKPEKGLGARIAARARKAGEFTLEKIADSVPLAGAIGAGLLTHYIVKDGFVPYGTDLVFDLPTGLDAIFSVFDAYLAYNFLTYARGRDFVRNLRNHRKSEGEKGSEVEEGGIAKRAFRWALDHPRITALVPASALLLLGMHYIEGPALAYIHVKDILESRYYTWDMFPERARKLFSSKEELSSALDVIAAQFVLMSTVPLPLFGYSASYFFTMFADANSQPGFKDMKKHRQKARYYRRRGRMDEALQEMDASCEALPARKVYLDAALSHIKAGYLDEALVNAEKGINSTREAKLLSFAERLTILSSHPCIRAYNKIKKAIKKDPDKIDNHLYLSILHMMVDDPDSAIRMQEDIERRFPCSIESRALYALMLESAGKDEKAKQKWAETIDMIIHQEGSSARFQRIGESANDVLEYIPSKFFRKAFVFKRGKISGLESEFMLTKEAMKIVDGAGMSHRYKTTEPVDIFDYEEGHAYVMKRDPGKLLYAIEDRRSALYDIADYLALMHARMDVGLSKKGRTDMIKALEEKLSSKDFDLPDHLADKIKSNYAPIINSLKDAPYVFNKDAHPEQWLVREDGAVVAIDWEDKGLAPMQFDLANLMEYDDSLDDHEKDSIIQKYISSYNSYCRGEGIKDMDGFRLAYLNSVIHRTLCLCSSWSAPGREDMAAKRGMLIKNALNSIGRIKSEFPEYYITYQDNYRGLISSFLDLSSLVVEHEKGC